MADTKYNVSRKTLLDAVKQPGDIVDFIINIKSDEMASEMKKSGKTFVYTPRAVDIVDEFTYDFVDNPDKKISLEDFFKGIQFNPTSDQIDDIISKMRPFAPSLRKDPKGYAFKWSELENLLKNLDSIGLKESKSETEGISYKNATCEFTGIVDPDGTAVPVESCDTTENVETPEQVKPKKQPKPSVKKDIADLFSKIKSEQARPTISYLRKFALTRKLISINDLATMCDEEVANKFGNYTTMDINGKKYFVNVKWLKDHADEISQNVFYDNDA